MTSKQSRVVGYNFQSAVETKHHLTVAHEVTNHGCDRDALAMMATAAQAEMEGPPLLSPRRALWGGGRDERIRIYVVPEERAVLTRLRLS